MLRKRLSVSIVMAVVWFCAPAQGYRADYEAFKKQAAEKYSGFRQQCNQKYAEFLKQSWERFEANEPIPQPMENTLPPRPFVKDDGGSPVEVAPIEVTPIRPTPQPRPIEPIRESPVPDGDSFKVLFYGVECGVRMPPAAKNAAAGTSPKEVAAAWERLSSCGLDNAIRDCLEARIRYNLCDWAYLMMLDELGRGYCTDANSATLLTAYLYCQSGYQMRLASGAGKLIMLYGSRHRIYNKSFYTIDGMNFYPLEALAGGISICNAKFEGETPLDLTIGAEMRLGNSLSEQRLLKSSKYADMCAPSQVPAPLIDFFNTYPSSAIGSNHLSRWAMYANTPLAQSTAATLYPALKAAIDGCTEEIAANKLLNWVQTAFEYEYDDKVWGGDRAFFAEETLYYPYCDCEDRSILFSRLVRDLLGLDVALVYYPGHLATAVCFNSAVGGDALTLGGRRFIVCDPTYIGAPVGAQMPGLDYGKTQAILLSR